MVGVLRAMPPIAESLRNNRVVIPLQRRVSAQNLAGAGMLRASTPLEVPQGPADPDDNSIILMPAAKSTWFAMWTRSANANIQLSEGVVARIDPTSLTGKGSFQARS